MSDHAIAALRWVALAITILCLLQGTILLDLFRRRVFEPWFAMNERLGARVPPLLRDTRFQRGWPLTMAVIFAGLWWWLGTQAARDWLHGLNP